MTPQSDLPVHRTPTMGLARRLAGLTAAMALLLVLGATEIALSLSERSRLEDLREESVALANTLAAYLNRVAPSGDPQALAQGLTGWSRRHITETRAWIYLEHENSLAPAAASDSGETPRADPADYRALSHREAVVRFVGDTSPGWLVTVPLGARSPFGVLDVKVSTRRLQDWARRERRRAYTLALISALMLSLGVALVTARWVGRPLEELGRAMAGAHGGAGGAPTAPEIGPPEFRELARRYNRLRDALANRERESAARAALLALEERARNYDRLTLMEETAAGFAHEIGTPLNTVSGHLQLLRDDLTAARDSSGVERVNLLLAQVGRVAAIVRAGLERGIWPQPRTQVTDLTQVAARMLRFLEPSFIQAGVTCTLNSGPGGSNGSAPVLADSDPALVEQILLNLLKNAIEALGPGGRVTVTSHWENGLGVIEITDDGPGLAAEARDHLFSPFTTTKGSGGTGLGLPVSRRLARILGGDLTYLPGDRGTHWRLTLPSGGT